LVGDIFELNLKIRKITTGKMTKYLIKAI